MTHPIGTTRRWLGDRSTTVRRWVLLAAVAIGLLGGGWGAYSLHIIGNDSATIKSQNTAILALAQHNLTSQANYHKATAVLLTEIKNDQQLLLAAHSATEVLLNNLTALTTEASKLGPALTAGQQQLLDNISAITSQVSQLQAETASLTSDISSLTQRVAALEAKQ